MTKIIWLIIYLLNFNTLITANARPRSPAAEWYHYEKTIGDGRFGTRSCFPGVSSSKRYPIPTTSPKLLIEWFDKNGIEYKELEEIRNKTGTLSSILISQQPKSDRDATIYYHFFKDITSCISRATVERNNPKTFGIPAPKTDENNHAEKWYVFEKQKRGARLKISQCTEGAKTQNFSTETPARLLEDLDKNRIYYEKSDETHDPQGKLLRVVIVRQPKGAFSITYSFFKDKFLCEAEMKTASSVKDEEQKNEDSAKDIKYGLPVNKNNEEWFYFVEYPNGTGTQTCQPGLLYNQRSPSALLQYLETMDGVGSYRKESESVDSAGDLTKIVIVERPTQPQSRRHYFFKSKDECKTEVKVIADKKALKTQHEIQENEEARKKKYGTYE